MDLNKFTLKAFLDKNFNVVIDDKDRLKFVLESFRDTNIIIDIYIDPEENSRTIKQNNYLRILYNYVSNWYMEFFGEEVSIDEVHAHNMQIIQKHKIKFKVIDGEEVIVFEKKRSSDMNKKEFSSMIESFKDYYYKKYGWVLPSAIKGKTINDYL